MRPKHHPDMNGVFQAGEPRVPAGLEPYQGPWNAQTAAHLLRRTIFGPTKSEIAFAASRSLEGVIAQLFQEQPPPPLPVDPTTGLTWIGNVFDSASDSRYQGYLKSWWMGLMATQGISLRERMVLFWHNHFPTGYQTVPDSRFLYRQNALFRSFAFGNIKELVKAVTVDPAMLYYLNGYRNRGDGNNTPDENYGRELQELFTIGKGPQIGPGDYTHYTEQDVKAAAHALTGWRAKGYRIPDDPNIDPYFWQQWHDTKDKVFSEAYQNTVISGGSDGARELNDLIEMIFRQPETARFLCRKLYRWFVYYEIDAAAEENVITPMADLLRGNNYEVRPVLEALFRSSHFYDVNNIGCMIRNPIDLIAGTLRRLEIPLPAPESQAAAFYPLMASLVNTAATLQMNLMEPPDVAGWPAYYLSPEFHRLWLNTITLPSRWAYTDSLVNGLRAAGSTYAVDVIAMAKQVSVPVEPKVLISEWAQILFPFGPTADQLEYLDRSVLIPGLPDYEWTQYWASYVADPNNTQKRSAVTTRLAALLKFMMRMAEFELS